MKVLLSVPDMSKVVRKIMCKKCSRWCEVGLVGRTFNSFDFIYDGWPLPWKVDTALGPSAEWNSQNASWSSGPT